MSGQYPARNENAVIYPAFDAREVTGRALLKDPSLMELWKWASNEGKVQAVSASGTNYVAVKDEDLAARLVALGVRARRYDSEAQRLI